MIQSRGRGRLMKVPTMAGAARVLVQAAPATVNDVATAVAKISGVQVSDLDPAAGKLALRVQYGNPGALAATLNKVSMVPGVTSATLAMQAEPTCGSVDD